MKNIQKKFFGCFGAAAVVFVLAGIGGYYAPKHAPWNSVPNVTFSANTSFAAVTEFEKYSGPIRHIFFHSLIIYPQKAAADRKHFRLYRRYMITVDRFKSILKELYENNFILIDSRLLYSVDSSGKIHKQDLYVPKGKKPLVLSVDDLSYYSSMKDGGFANKLVLDNGIVKTEVITPKGDKIVTDDGDVVPIVDRFVEEHPDFSLNGAKGIIALTGFEGILGYRTQLQGDEGQREKESAMPVVSALKKSGWIFASHSFSHQADFANMKISATALADDILLWKSQVEPLIGPTNIFIGPFGQTFNDGDPRRNQLVAAGFNVLYRVGADEYVKYYANYVVIDRIDFDGYRLSNSVRRLLGLFGLRF